MARDAPAWRQGFNEVERWIGRPLESATNTPSVIGALVQAGRLQRAITQPVDRVASWALHLVGLPSNRDMRGLHHQIAALQREVGALRRDVAAASRPAPRDG